MGPSSARLSSSSRVQLRALSPGLIEIHCSGEVLVEDTDYLPQLGRQLEQEPHRCCLLYHTLDISSFAPEFPVRHLHFFRSHRAHIAGIAVVYKLRSVEMAILAVRLGTGVDIQGFSNEGDAMSWLGTIAGVSRGCSGELAKEWQPKRSLR